jgi:molybdopterin/thiamine biosynthesis adenylyltransferase
MSDPLLDVKTDPSATGPAQGGWSYEEAFCRNLGLIDARDQETLRDSRVAIPGMGGVGGVHLLTLARLGVGKFRITDPDTFSVANFNRQVGAELQTLDCVKAEVMRERALQINPELEIDSMDEPISADNIDAFLDDVDVVVDSIDFFSFETRRLLFGRSRQRGLWVVTAGPIGFSAAWLLFDPAGMSFDRYFDMHDGMDPIDQFAAFWLGLTPRATHTEYYDLSRMDSRAAHGPSVGLACNLCSGVAAVEVAKIILGRGDLRPAPHYAQFDAYRCLLRRGRLRGGNRHPLQRLKRRKLRRLLLELGHGAAR